MKFKAFTLIELMVTLGVITIIATASVPQVQMWIARNKGIQIVSQVISDFSKAETLETPNEI
ncbi:MAG TPA: prepilin-type N-terminal cleavage/methylation domain-containing protein [bacterium]|nr:prepilin-type N-terminal cleavage/methylation domain-containing protein [bacterium]